VSSFPVGTIVFECVGVWDVVEDEEPVCACFQGSSCQGKYLFVGEVFCRQVEVLCEVGDVGEESSGLFCM